MATNSSNSDRPVITSGMTSGATAMPENSSRPRRGSSAMLPTSAPSAARAFGSGPAACSAARSAASATSETENV